MIRLRSEKWSYPSSDIDYCQRCKRKARLLYVKFEKYTGLILWFTRATYEGGLCAECTKSLYKECQRATLFGLMDILTIPAGIICLVNNALQFRNVMRTFNSKSKSAFDI